jgi:hypothetical protein
MFSLRFVVRGFAVKQPRIARLAMHFNWKLESPKLKSSRMSRDAEVVKKTIDEWERKAGELVADGQAELTQRRSLLELHIEANPVRMKPACLVPCCRLID